MLFHSLGLGQDAFSWLLCLIPKMSLLEHPLGSQCFAEEKKSIIHLFSFETRSHTSQAASNSLYNMFDLERRILLPLPHISCWNNRGVPPGPISIKPSGAVVANTFNPCTWEAEAGRSLWVRCQLSLQKLVPGQAPKQHRETLSWKTQKEKKILFRIIVKFGNISPNILSYMRYKIQGTLSTT